MTRTLVRCGFIVSMDETVGELRNAEILIEDDRIAAIGGELNAATDHVIDARDMIVMPGLVNAHMHTFQAGLRAVGSEWLSHDYFQHLYGNISTRYTPEDNYLGTLLGALNQLNNGVTTLLDYSHNLTSREQAEHSIDALEEAGLRAVFVLGRGRLPPQAQQGASPEQRRHDRSTAVALRRGRLANDHARVTMALAVLGPHWATWEATVESVALARELSLLASSHVTLRHDQGVVPRGYVRMVEEGMLGPDHNLVHCQNLTREELQQLVDTGASVTSTCMNELHDYPVYPAAGRVHALGALPSLGIDVEAMVAGDMWREMQMALLFARNEALREAAAQGAPATGMPLKSRTALAWATRGGARALRMEDRIGALAPGRKADIIMLRATDLNLWPVHDAALAVVEQAHAGNVDTVMVDGIIRKQHGRLLYDERTLRRKQAELAASAQRLMAEAGYRASA